MESDLEKDSEIRAKLERELQNIKQCAYQPFDCTQLSLPDYRFCTRHILQDKCAPYKQCAHVYNSNGKSCHLPAPRDKKDGGYCAEHALKLHLNSSKRNSYCQPPRTAEVLLNHVSHYIKRPKSQQSEESRPAEEGEAIVTKSLDPFVDIDSNGILASGNDVLDMCSESDSDIEPSVYGSVWHDENAETSEDDSQDSEQDDLLKHANVYSSEEVTLLTKDKLKRLQSLYIDQYSYLHHALREHRREYLLALKQEKETHCNIYNQVHDNRKEQRLYKKLKAYNSYHKAHGDEAVCVKRLHERRMKITEGVPPKQPSYTKCIFSEWDIKCGERALPVTRHCHKHILEDPQQILFRACGKMCGDIECITPVETIFGDGTCRLHTDFPPIRSYQQIRKDSESDFEDAATHLSDNVKIEDIKIEENLLPDFDLDAEMLEPGSGYDFEPNGSFEPPKMVGEDGEFKEEVIPEDTDKTEAFMDISI